MKKIISITIFSLSLYSCEPITKIALPHTGTPPRITYTKELKTTVKKEVNYDKLIKNIFILCPKAKLVIDDKPNGNFQIVGYTPYNYKDRELQLSYRLNGNITDGNCNLTINGMYMVHYAIERIYFNDKRHNLKKFNESYGDIDKRITELMNAFATHVQ